MLRKASPHLKHHQKTLGQQLENNR